MNGMLDAGGHKAASAPGVWGHFVNQDYKLALSGFGVIGMRIQLG